MYYVHRSDWWERRIALTIRMYVRNVRAILSIGGSVDRWRSGPRVMGFGKRRGRLPFHRVSAFSLSADRLPIFARLADSTRDSVIDPASPCRISSAISRRPVLPWKSRVPRVSRDRLRSMWRKRRTGYVKPPRIQSSTDTPIDMIDACISSISFFLVFPFFFFFFFSFIPVKIVFQIVNS